MRKLFIWICAAALASGGIHAVNASDEPVIHIDAQETHEKNFPIDGVGTEYYGTVFAKNTLEIQTSLVDTFPEEGLIVTYNFDVLEEGDYRLTVSASQHAGSGLTYLSPYGVSVNGDEFTEINTENAGAASNPNGGFNYDCPDVSDSAKFPIAIYNTNLYYHFTPGENTVSFKVLSAREMDNKAFAALAYIEFEKQPDPEIQSSYVIMGSDGHSLEYDTSADGVVEDTTSLPGTLNVKTLADTPFPNGGITIIYNFRSETEGRYRLSLSASAHTRTSTLSTYAVSVNGSEFSVIDSATAGPAEAPNGGWSKTITGVDSLIGVYKTNLVYDIGQGMNTVAIKILTPRDSDNRAYFYLEYIKLQLLDTFAEASFTDAEKHIEIGTSDNAGVRAIGETGADMDITEADVIYSSDAPNVVSVSGDGVLTAVGTGKAVITAVVSMDGTEREAQLPVYVTVNEKYASSVAFKSNGAAITTLPDSGSITAETEIRNYGDAPAEVTLVTAVYNDTGMISCAAESVTVGAGETSTLGSELNCDGGEYAAAYVYEDFAAQLPLSRADIISR